MRLKTTRFTKRSAEAVKDIDYADKLSPDESAWLATFVDGHYSNDAGAQAALETDPEARKEWSREANRATYMRRCDVMLRHKRSALIDGDIERNLEWEGEVAPDFESWQCPVCYQKPCVCPERSRSSTYGAEDYMPADVSVEDALAEAIDARSAEDRECLPYGTNPQNLCPGHQVIICLPSHYLKDRQGVVLAYRKWTNQYLIEADRPGLRDRDGTASPKTLCWVRPEGLKRFAPKLAR